MNRIGAPVALTRSEVQRGGFPARRVPAVHILRAHKLLHPLQVSAPAGLEQLPARLGRPRALHEPREAPDRHGQARGGEWEMWNTHYSKGST